MNFKTPMNKPHPPVGRVSPQGVTRQTPPEGTINDVGLRCANPTYTALPSGWRWETVDSVKASGRSIVSGPFGSNIGKRFFVERGIPVIRGNNLSLGMGRFVDDGFVFLTDEKAGEFKNCEAHPDDLIFTAAGTIGQVGIIPHATKHSKYIISNKQLRARLDHSKILPLFAYYWLASPPMVAMIQNRNTGSTIPLINLSVLKSLPIPVPPLAIQTGVVGFLSTLDDRITLLRETNATLEAIAQALFKSWFVDFDPVHAKQQGRAPEGMDEATAALFPDGFEESALGLVPKGWRVEALPDVFDFREGPGIRNWQYTNTNQGTRFINIRCIQNGDLSIETANRITDDEANGKYAHFHLQAWDVVVSTSGTLGRSAIVRDEHLPLMLNTSVIRFQPVSGKSKFSFVYEYLNAPDFLFKLESMASGSVQKNFGPMHLKQIKLVCPPFDLVSHFEDVSRPLFSKLVGNRAKAQTLATLRDTLLPRLISGQLRLPEAESIALKCASIGDLRTVVPASQ